MDLSKALKIVINLPERTDRLEQFNKELPKLFPGETAQVINGVKGDIVSAHKKAIEYAIYNKAENVIIMEDDLKLSDSKELIPYVNKAFENLPDGIEIFSGGIYGGSMKYRNEYWSEINHFAGAHFLVYKKSILDRIRNYDFGSMHYDRALSKIGRCAVSNFYFATQYNGYSDHRKKVVNDDHYLHGTKLLI